MTLPVVRQHLLHQTLVIGIGELGIAAQGVLLVQPGRVVRVVAIGGAGAGDDKLADPGAQTGVEHIAGAVHVDVVIPRPVAGILQHRGQVDHGVDALLAQQLAQRGVADIPFPAFKRQPRRHPQIQPQHGVALGQPLAEQAPDITAGASDQYPAHTPSLATGSAERDQISASARPLTRCQTPQKPAIRIMPAACGKKVNRIASPRPEF